MFSQQTVAVYYARDVLGNANYYIVLTVVSTAGMVLASRSSPRRSRRSARSMPTVAGVIAAAAPWGLPWRPGRPRRSDSCATACSASGWAHQHADLRAAGRHRRLRRMEERHPRRGRRYSVLSFTRKTGQGSAGRPPPTRSVGRLRLWRGGPDRLGPHLDPARRRDRPGRSRHRRLGGHAGLPADRGPSAPSSPRRPNAAPRPNCSDRERH